ncbi:CHAD domain-containing protein [Streptomyces bambusae]|uniref:CHAD domain-containing protein n=1 Tax=Streptomyces bambusae TaxID=1550616 RepID=UPI001CFF2DC3|nr:CHAD domain-containing protein [Streptomyces bambusae]MCB5166217.1 CHAD domain-containing protein [Streptomyces bambusae]
MALPNPDPCAGDVLGAYLRAQATAFLRGLRLHEESGADAAESTEAARVLRGAARRIRSSLVTFRPVTETAWADGLRTELAWLSATLSDEHAYAARLNRLLDALHRLSGAPGVPAPRGAARSALTVGSARAAALLDRQLSLARTRAHSATLQALGSARFHAVADAVAVLASEVPLDRIAAAGRTDDVLVPLAAQAADRLAEAAGALPLVRAAHPYNAEALVDDEQQDAPWHRVRSLLHVHRYAQEALAADVTRLTAAGEALDRHRDAAEAAAASAAAARTPRIAPATAYALGVLHADQRHEVEAARYAFQRIWQRAGEPTGAGAGTTAAAGAGA